MLVRFHEIFQLELLSLRWGLPHEQFSRFVFDQFLVLRFIFAAAGFGFEFLDFSALSAALFIRTASLDLCPFLPLIGMVLWNTDLSPKFRHYS
jgi:hypothetical protein